MKAASVRNTVLVVLAVVAALMLITVRASAGTGNDCPSNTVCLYNTSTWDTLLGYRGGNQGLSNISAANNDKVSSWWNKSSWNARYYNNSNGGGLCQNMLAGTHGAAGALTNNAASSWATNGAC